MMHPSISRSYLVPAILLNPVLFLISINTILSRVLPPILVDAAVQPPPYTALGPSPEHPHLDIHTSESLCWSYTILIVCAQLVAFGRVSGRREEGRARVKMSKQRIMVDVSSKEIKSTINFKDCPQQGSGVRRRDAVNAEDEPSDNHDESDLEPSSTGGSDGYPESCDSEVIL